MAETQQVVTIARPPDQVWSVLAGYGDIARWAPNVDHSCPTTEQTEGIGAVRRVQVGRNALLERVVAWEPGCKLAYAIEGLPPVVRSVTNTWDVEDAVGGSTVTLTSNVDAGPRPPQQLVARIIANRLAKASHQMLTGLKAHLEETPG